MKFSTIAIGSASLFLIAAAVAQTAPPPGTVGQRKANQQARIAEGVDGGKLTAADRAALNNRQNKISNSIYKDKHNAAVQ